MIKKKLSFFISTLFYTGYLPVAPGTAGSLLSFVFIVPAVYFYGFNGLLSVTAAVFVVSLYTVKETLKYTEHDPGFIVIDEFIGQSVSVLPVAELLKNDMTYWYFYAAGFVFFRIFDIKKPFPVSYFDIKIKNAFGVIMDDVAAGIYAALSIFLLKLLFL